MYVFKDRDPDAKYHYQMIPKWHIKNTGYLKPDNNLHSLLINHLLEKGPLLMKEWH